MMDRETARERGYRRFGVYVNPTGVWFRESRLKSEAQRLGLAWWVYATDRDDALDYLMGLTVNPTTWEFLRRYRNDPRRVLIEEDDDE